MSSLIYEVPRLLRAIYVRSRILNSVLNFTGSQCREAKTGVIWFLLLVPVSTHAAAFGTSWRLFTDLLGHPDNIELHQSSLEVPNAWTSFSAYFWDRMFLNFIILPRFFLCGSNDISLSHITPRFLTVDLIRQCFSEMFRANFYF